MSFAALAPLAINQLGGASAGGAPAPTNQTFNPTSPINVAPVGVNIGEIIKGYEQGGVTNGGSGARIPSRYATQYVGGTNNIPAESESAMDQGQLILWAGLAIVTAGAFFLIFRRA